jgi:hypothetical protein
MRVPPPLSGTETHHRAAHSFFCPKPTPTPHPILVGFGLTYRDGGPPSGGFALTGLGRGIGGVVIPLTTGALGRFSVSQSGNSEYHLVGGLPYRENALTTGSVGGVSGE